MRYRTTTDLTTAGRGLRIEHPGPAAATRIEARTARMLRIEAELPAGRPICESIGAVLSGYGITAAALQFDGVSFGPMRYVQPAYSDDPARVAWFSETRAPAGKVTIDRMAASYGLRDGAPSIHCHALWTDAQGLWQGGHILPFEAQLASPAYMIAYGTRDALFEVTPDAETGFDLFGLGAGAHVPRGTLVIAHLRPNVDLVTACETICADLGIASARILSGIGSTIGARLDGQPDIAPIPTELVLTNGHIRYTNEGWDVDLPTGLIDIEGRVHFGRPARGRNPVLICFELFLEVESFQNSPAAD